MADEPESAPPASTQHIPLIYSNVVSITAGAVDVALDFGYRGPDGQVMMAVRVAMAPEHADLLHGILGRMLDRYREDVGEIRDVSKVTEIRPLQIGPNMTPEGSKE